jgi:hypothetical protein
MGEMTPMDGEDEIKYDPKLRDVEDAAPSDDDDDEKFPRLRALVAKLWKDSDSDRSA